MSENGFQNELIKIIWKRSDGLRRMAIIQQVKDFKPASGLNFPADLIEWKDRGHKFAAIDIGNIATVDPKIMHEKRWNYLR